MKERIENTIFVSAYNLSPEALQQYVGVLNRTRPKYFYGYASACICLRNIFFRII